MESVGFPDSSDRKESACNAGDPGSIPGLGRSPGERQGYPTPVFWFREFHGLYRPWGRKESDITERLSLSLQWKLGKMYRTIWAIYTVESTACHAQNYLGAKGKESDDIWVSGLSH